MNSYTITFTGCLIGAIGKHHKITATVQAEDEKSAILALYDKYEHISQPKIKHVEAAEYKYYKNTENGKIYRTKESQYNTGEKYTLLQRYSFDFENWGGHIAHHEQTRKQMEELENAVEITEEEVKRITKG